MDINVHPVKDLGYKMGYRVASHWKNMKQWQQWTNDQCTLCKDSSHPEMATHLFNCTALTQPALQEDAVQLVQECLYCLQDQTLVALSLLTDISKYLLALPAGYL